MENRVENGHRANFRPILEFGVPLGFNGLNHIYYILMEYLSVFFGSLFTRCQFKLGVYGACKGIFKRKLGVYGDFKDIFKHFDDGSHEIFGK